MVERTDDHPWTGSATYCSAVSLRQASRTLVLAQRSYANNATTSSCMRITPGLRQGHCRYCRAERTNASGRPQVRESEAPTCSATLRPYAGLRKAITLDEFLVDPAAFRARDKVHLRC